jgi:Alginate lyase
MLANIVGISFGIVKTRINAQVLNWTSHPSFLVILKDMYCNSEELPNSQIMKQFVKQADRILVQKPHSVLEKIELPPSGDKHDFLALAPYRWPNPEKTDGLPYIGHDGIVNPEIYEIPDKKNFDEMIKMVKLLSITYYITRNDTYAFKASELIRSWFLNEDTRMNPNLNYGELNRGIKQINPSGIMAGRNITDVLESIHLIKYSNLWTERDQKEIISWFEKYLNWLLYSDVGEKEAEKINNHKTYYNMQVSAIAVFLNKTDIAEKIIEETLKRLIPKTIMSDGRQPEELKRTRSLYYSEFNLLGLFRLASVAENIGINMWDYETKDGAGLKKALDFLIPYIGGEKLWDYPQIGPLKNEVLEELLAFAYSHYRDKSYLELCNALLFGKQD